MLGCRLGPECSRYVLLVVSIVILLGSVGTSDASAYYSLTKEPKATVSSPEVILQNGTAGTSTIYTNSTSAKVGVSSMHTNETEDYVDLLSDVDNSTDIGVHSNFTAQQFGPDLINDMLTEENMGNNSFSMWLDVDSFDGEWNAWTVVGTDPYLDAIDYNSSYVHVSGNLRNIGSFNFTDSGKTTETINNVTIQLYAKQSEIGKNIEVKFWVNSTWYSLGDQVTPTSWGWMNWTATTELDTWPKIDDAKIHIKSKAPQGTFYVDCARLQVDYTTPDSYELDVEVQWTNTDFNETNEELCIFGGTMGAENITAEVWNGTAWQNLFTDLDSGWNNKTVTSFLTSSNFTIRFKGGSEISDTTQDSWNIDATLLHTWTYVETTYYYVLRANNTAANPWEVRLKKYSNSSIGHLQNCTIYFRNSTSANSTQIIIKNGSFNQTEGPWYALGSLETIYIAMTVEANSTGTSIVRTYLEIRVLGTTTYLQYIIAFEIT
jgi:hypothetical protein